MAPEHPLIPFDILDEIVYFLHDDHTTLRALALVSEILLPRCRRLLFHRTDLRIDHPGNYILINLFIDHPEIRTYIQTLSLSLVTPAYPTGQQDLSYYVGAFKVLQFLICELDHIEHFVLEDFYWNGTIAKQMNPSIRRILALPSLKAITFRNVTNLPLTCLYYCRYLTQLEFDLVEFTENLSVFEGPAPDSNVIHLKSLSVNNDKIYPERPFVAAAVSGFLDGEKQRIDVSHLDHVSIFAAGNSDGQFFWKIVRKTATSLRSLSLICNVDSYLSEFDLGIFPQLTSVHLSLVDFGIADMLYTAIRMFNRPSGVCSLQKLHLDMHISAVESIELTCRDAAWTGLEDVLLQPEYEKLTLIVVDFTTVDNGTTGTALWLGFGDDYLTSPWTVQYKEHGDRTEVDCLFPRFRKTLRVCNVVVN